MRNRTTFIIIYRNREPFFNSTDDNVEGAIRYWLHKSPGMYRDDIDQIISFPTSSMTDHTELLSKIHEEELRYERKQQEDREREQYEQLKRKYEGK